MDFRFTDEQQMLRETAQAFLREHSDSAAVRRAMATERGFDDGLWRQLSGELGWSAIHIPEAHGGLGLGAVELIALMEQMGQQLLCAPFFSSICLGATAILQAADEQQKAMLLPGIADGSVRAALGWMGKGCDWGAAGITASCSRGHGPLPQEDRGQGPLPPSSAGPARDRTNAIDPVASTSAAASVGAGLARDHDNAWTIDGEYRHVIDGHTADLLVVAARLPGSNGTDGIRLFALPANTPGITRQWLPTMDQTRKLATLRFDQVRASESALLGGNRDSWPALERALQIATIALAAEQAGGARHVLDMAVEYTKERKQFGRAIASFQAIKHKAADMLVRAEAARSAAYYAACIADAALRGDPLGEELPRAASLAKAYCSEAFFFNAGSALQLFGGVGFTWEYDLHLHFKRARASEAFLGEPAHHRERIARELGL